MRVVWQEFFNNEWIKGESDDMRPCDAKTFEYYLRKQPNIREVAFCES